jgi:hypothetical protein
MLSLKVVENPNGVVVYRGRSVINGKMIVAVVTGLRAASENRKTGGLVQVWILPLKEKPSKAVFSGADESVCGDCVHRYVGGAGSCYVNPVHGPGGVWNGVERGIYPVVAPSEAAKMVAGKMVRLGAYGDPAAVPIKVWDELLVEAGGWTGYTHQWRKKFAQGLKRYCMASCELPGHRLYAKRLGWRTFRVRSEASEPLMEGEFACPASEEEGKRLTCDECGACGGGDPRKASPAIVAHGTNWKVIRYRKVVSLMRRKKKYRGIFN